MSLTPRQLDCLRLAADGLRHDDIAGRLHISPRVVRKDLSAAIHELHARSTTHAVAIAYRRGILGDSTTRQQVALVQLAERMGCWIALVPGRSA
jgi:DNA-binding CsgD family transcriptional regulator